MEVRFIVHLSRDNNDLALSSRCLRRRAHFTAQPRFQNHPDPKVAPFESSWNLEPGHISCGFARISGEAAGQFCDFADTNGSKAGVAAGRTPEISSY